MMILPFLVKYGININNLKDELAFVAIKNGKHNGLGYIFSNFKLGINDNLRLDKLYDLIINLAVKDFNNKKVI